MFTPYLSHGGGVNTPTLCLEVLGFRHWTIDQLSLLRFVVVFFTPIIHFPISTLKYITIDTSLMSLLIFIFYYLTYAIKSRKK